MQDVSQIASGGEIARLMLSLKAILSAHQNLPTIIFDEIDTGVSGKMAERMAEVMQQMAKTCQVICITHLPQIAALGSEHYFVYKTEHDDATTSTLKHLTPDERIREIATMLSGAELTDAAMENAKALLRI
jgi:DNA repair protein RecN (Recombination protein N)